MKHLLAILLVIPFLSFSQANIEKILDRVSTKTQAQAFLKRYKTKVSGEIITMTEGDAELFALKKGEKLKRGNTTFKVISKGKAASYNINIMEFDSNKTTISEINSLRSFILKGIKSGEHKFQNLARVYSSHPSAKTGGNLGWQNAGTFSKRFEKIISEKRKDQVFAYDEYRQKKHYVVYKNEDNKSVEQITVLKVTEI